MTRTSRQRLLPVACALTLLAGLAWAADVAAPKVSAFAPADDLAALVGDYVEDIGAIVGDESVFASDDGRQRLTDYAAALEVVALALALSDEEHDLKKSAGALLQSADELGAAKDRQAAQAALDKIEAAAAGRAQAASPEKLSWKKVAPLGALMNQVTAADTQLRRGLRRLERRPESVHQPAALLAVIAQEAMHDPPEGAEGEKLAAWRKYCSQMRDAAGELNRAAHAKDTAAATAAVAKLQQSCDACHETFQIE